ncbi:DEAD/DEAH box helicase [Clostridium sp. YIM B02515]|uniref:DEAD/DEAH box helicase n=1 Tax=Clostridium rhizosphaerae TaxID=2803861 RepID=A0ABS1TC04_9CLOT|nr:DEAD/DEAH box helicase [Clostridium rhizosphaerae]MBL4936627.1 DEAD/DEAH box helicase [Clostridium rhizosphaerae]
MKQDMLLQILKESTSGKNYDKAQRIIDNDLVSTINIINEGELICIDGFVISENLFNEYTTKIELDATKKEVFSTFCSCTDYEKNEFKKKNYACKHIAATFYKALEELVKHPLFNEEGILNKDPINKGRLLDMLLGSDRDKEEIKLEVYINKKEWNEDISAEFKIGLKSMSSNSLYILKDIEQFLVSLYNNMPVTYSKNFTFDIKNQKLSTKDKRLIDFIEMLKTIEGSNKYVNRSNASAVDGKYLNIPKYLTRDFAEAIKDHRVYLNEGFFHRPVEAEILYEAPPIDFDLKLIKNEYVLKSPNGMPQSLGSKKDVFVYGSDIYVPSYEFCYRISPYLQVFAGQKVAVFQNEEEETVLRRLIPQLNFLSPKVTLSKTIKDKIIMGSCNFNFYFNRENGEVTLFVKVSYDGCEFNIFEDYIEKIVYRDSKKEAEVIDILRGFGFEDIGNKFHFNREDDYIFRFFKYDIEKLQEIGEVFYSENFKGLKSIGSKGIKGDIKAGKFNYFEMEFKIGDIPPQETSDILRAFRDNLKFYKLKSGEYIDLEELELNKLLKLIDAVAVKGIDNNHIEIAKNRASYIESFIEENELRFIKGKSELKKVSDKLKHIDKLKFEQPKDLLADLREYQKTGYNWFKTLDYLGLGGVLGDEMGLGKTIQAIAFILGNKGSKSLIAAPTSLVYNWVSEFEKFAPTVRVAAVNGSKEEREEIIKNIDKYDVFITTYNLLKRDLDSYNSIEFNYFILDEAQYIKNAGSQNALAVKEIKAKTRFALSGTPIENSLMELWSIFDFIMPGYLYDEKRFSVRYHKRLREEPVVIEEINRLIKPFILRRMKKEVIKELPDKIEKIITVDMEEEQKKVYKAYANYAVELIEKRVKDYEFENSKIEILSYITKLRQLCLDPSVLMEDYRGDSAKLEALVELLEQSIEEGHRVLVFSQFTSVLKNIGKRISKEGISFSYLDGSIPSEKRMNMVKAFNEGENSVFLISLKAGGTGLNLTSADVVIHFDPWWNPAVEEQATDRAHRIGQKNVVEVIKLIAKGTIEEKILKLQEDKKKLISEVMGDELSGGEGFASLSEEELIQLFSL